VVQPRIYSGYGLSQKGDKGRFILPPELRRQVRDASENQNVLCVAKHQKWNCLIGFGTTRESEFHAILERERQDARDRGDSEWDWDVRSQQLVSYTRLPFDESGRFLVPDHLLKIGRIGDEIYFQGSNGYIMMWNHAELEKMGPAFEATIANCQGVREAARHDGRRRK